MSELRKQGHRGEFAEEYASLFQLVLGPVVWATHFVWSYAGTAIYCAKFAGPGGDATTLRIAVAVAGAVALALLLWLGWRAWRQGGFRDDIDPAHDQPDDEGRHRFLGHAALLLIIVSIVGVIYSTLPVLVLEGCR